MKLQIPFILLCTLIFGCKTAHYTPKTYKGEQLIAGTSGGVTGMMKEYVLLDNGQLFLSKGIAGDYRMMRKLKKSMTHDLFERARDLEFPARKFDHPGNITYYLILRNPTRSYQVKWGESGMTPPEGFSQFYEYLMSKF